MNKKQQQRKINKTKRMKNIITKKREWKKMRSTRTTTPPRCHQTSLRKSFERFYQLISCETTEEVIAKAEEFGEQGVLTEGVVAAAHAMLEESKKRNDDERVIASLQGVSEFSRAVVSKV